MGISGSTNRGVNIRTISDLVRSDSEQNASDNGSTTQLYADSVSSSGKTCCCNYPLSKFRLKNFERTFVLLGLGHVFLGILSITCGLMVLFGGNIYWTNEIAVGIWCGASYLIPGVIGSLTSWGIGRKKTTAKVYASLSAITAILSWFPVSWYFVFFQPIVNDCTPNVNCPMGLQVIAEVILVVLSAAEFIISVVTIGSVITSRITRTRQQQEATGHRGDPRSRSLPLTLGEYWHSLPPFNIIVPDDSPPPYVYDNMGFSQEGNSPRNNQHPSDLIPLNPPPYSNEPSALEEDSSLANGTNQAVANLGDHQVQADNMGSTELLCLQLERPATDRTQLVETSSPDETSPHGTVSPTPVSLFDGAKATSPISVVLADDEAGNSFEPTSPKSSEPTTMERQLSEQEKVVTSISLTSVQLPLNPEKLANKISATPEYHHDESPGFESHDLENKDNHLEFKMVDLSNNETERVKDKESDNEGLPTSFNHNQKNVEADSDELLGKEICKFNNDLTNGTLTTSPQVGSDKFSSQDSESPPKSSSHNQKNVETDSDELLGKDLCKSNENRKPEINGTLITSPQVVSDNLSSQPSRSKRNECENFTMQEESDQIDSSTLHEICNEEPRHPDQQDSTEEECLTDDVVCINNDEPNLSLPNNSNNMLNEQTTIPGLELSDSMQQSSVGTSILLDKIECAATPGDSMQQSSVETGTSMLLDKNESPSAEETDEYFLNLHSHSVPVTKMEALVENDVPNCEARQNPEVALPTSENTWYI